MGCQNNTAVAVSRLKLIQCIACRSSFVMSVVWQVRFSGKTFLQSASCNPYCQLILKSFVNAYSFIFNVTSLPNL